MDQELFWLQSQKKKVQKEKEKEKNEWFREMCYPSFPY